MVSSTRAALAKGAGMAQKAVAAQHAATVKGLKTSATKHCIFRAVRKMRAALAPFVEV